MPTPRPQTLELVKNLLRRDLKLGQGADIPDDMPFFGGDIDLDSLDILLLMTSIEKQFKIRVPSEAVGKQVFQNVTSLATYIDESGGEAVASQSNAVASPQPPDYLSRLPHGESFRFITEVTQVAEGQRGEATWSLKGDEPFFAGHFPGHPIVPGVLIAEALAQLSGLVGAGAATEGGKLAHLDIRFERTVTPPAKIILLSRLSRVMGELQQFEVSATLDQSTVAQGSLALHRGPHA